MLAALTPSSAAILRVLQCVAASGLLWVVSSTNRATSTFTGGAPRGGLARCPRAARGCKTAELRGPTAATQRAARTSSYALAMCKLSEGPENGESTFQASMEWQTAAAHAILTSAGMRVCDRESERELGYNKKDLWNSSVKVM